MDEELIEGILRKDSKMILAFIQRYQNMVYSQTYRMLHDQQDAEEACQDVFIKALSKINTFQKGSKLSTWIYRIGYTTCLDIIKKRNRQPKTLHIDDAATISWANLHTGLEVLELKEQRSMIDQSLNKLDETDALLLDLYHLQELSIAEISVITDMRISAIKVRLMRARKKLAIHLKKMINTTTKKQNYEQ